MKAALRLSPARAVALAALLGGANIGAGSVRAAGYTWDGGTTNGPTANDNWSTASNWGGGAVPVSGSSTDLVFTQSAHTAATQDTGSAFTLSSLTFDATSNFTTLNGTNDTNGLAFNPASGGVAHVNQNSATNVTINNPISVVGTLAFNVSPGDNLILTGVLSGGVSNVTLNGGGTLTYGNGGTAAPNTHGGYTRVTSGTLALSRASQAINAGQVYVGNASNPGAAGSAVLRLDANNQLHQSVVNTYADGLFNLNDHTGGDVDELVMTGGEVRVGTGSLPVGSSFTGTGIQSLASATTALISSTNHAANNLVLGVSANRTIPFNVARGTATYDLDIQAGFSGGSGNVQVNRIGTGVLRLGGTDVLPVTLTSGTLAVANDAALSSFTFTFAGGTLTADSGDRTLANAMNVIGNATVGASLDGTPRAFIFNGGTTVSAGVTLTINNTAATNFSGGVSLVSNATFTDNATGATTVGALTLNGGNVTLLSNSALTAVTGSVSLGANTLTVTGTGAPTNSGNVSGTGGLLKIGSGTLTLSGTNGFSGGLIVNAGTLLAKNNASLGPATGAVTVGNGATLGFTDAAVSTARTINLVNANLTPAAGGSITYNAATVNGGALGAGSHLLNDATRLDGVRAATGAALSQNSGTATFNNVLLAGTASFTQAAGATLNATGDFTANPQTTLTVNGTVNTTAGGSLSGGVTINKGGALANNGAALYLSMAAGARR